MRLAFGALNKGMGLIEFFRRLHPPSNREWAVEKLCFRGLALAYSADLQSAEADFRSAKAEAAASAAKAGRDGRWRGLLRVR
jgi:hypothetical protein